ncbi:hypothetical protein TcWFU_009167 [Taenia crassiceps]|uniref:Uncharacterized protein n=1 Tax=Taenia crassiceps TaxID=6207 RepID=A0ABR4QTK1_9CEST
MVTEEPLLLMRGFSDSIPILPVNQKGVRGGGAAGGAGVGGSVDGAVSSSDSFTTLQLRCKSKKALKGKAALHHLGISGCLKANTHFPSAHLPSSFL